MLWEDQKHFSIGHAGRLKIEIREEQGAWSCWCLPFVANYGLSALDREDAKRLAVETLEDRLEDTLATLRDESVHRFVRAIRAIFGV